MVIPESEGAEGYHDYGFHFWGFFEGNSLFGGGRIDHWRNRIALLMMPNLDVE